jgi:hypothetical protein
MLVHKPTLIKYQFSATLTPLLAFFAQLINKKKASSSLSFTIELRITTESKL